MDSWAYAGHSLYIQKVILMIKAVIFDIDNTLYDYDSANAAAMTAIEDYCLENFGWSREETERKVKDSFDEIRIMHGRKAVTHNRLVRFQRILEKEGIPLFPHALRMYDIYWETLTGSSEPFPGLTEALEVLRSRGTILGIGTNMTSVMQFRKLETYGLLSYFDFIVSSEEAGSEKPDKILFRMCVTKAGCEASECLYVGDNLKNDVQAAMRAGLNAAWFNPEKAPLPDGAPLPVDHIAHQEAEDDIIRFSRFEELPDLVLNIK